MKIRSELEVFASLQEDSNVGWVWLPSFDSNLRTRDFIKLTFGESSIICVARILDENFLAHYKKGRTRLISDPQRALVISAYYRDKLGSIQPGRKYIFEIKRIMACNFISKTRALLQHPDNITKVAGWLAVISIALSALGVILSVYSILAKHCN